MANADWAELPVLDLSGLEQSADDRVAFLADLRRTAYYYNEGLRWRVIAR